MLLILQCDKGARCLTEQEPNCTKRKSKLSSCDVTLNINPRSFFMPTEASTDDPQIKDFRLHGSKWLKFLRTKWVNNLIHIE